MKTRLVVPPSKLAAAAAVVLAGPALAQQVVLKVHHFLPATSNVNTNLIQPWCDVDVPAGQFKFANSIFAFLMNQAKYDSLPPELKKVIDANSGAATSAWAGGTGFDGVVAANHKLAGDRGNALLKLSEPEYQRFVKASENVDDDWVKDVSAKGANGKALLDDARAMIQQYDK